MLISSRHICIRSIWLTYFMENEVIGAQTHDWNERGVCVCVCVCARANSDSQVHVQCKFSTSVQLTLRLATLMTCVDLRLLWSSSNLHTSPPNKSRHTMIAGYLYMREIYNFLQLASRLTNPFGHAAIASPHASSGCVDLHDNLWGTVWPGQ